MPNKIRSAYNAFNDLFTYRCGKGVSTERFIVDFQLKVNKVKSLGSTLSDNLLGYMLLSCANLSKNRLDMVKASCKEWSYSNVKAQLLKLGLGNTNIDDVCTEFDASKVQIENCFYSTLSKNHCGNYSQRNNDDCCTFCKCTYHHIADCPYVPTDVKTDVLDVSKSSNLKSKKVKQLKTKASNKFFTLHVASDSEQLSSLVGETLGKAVVDTGSPHTVAGEIWFKSYVNSLSRRDRLSIHLSKSYKRFCFGGNKSYHSKYYTVIPIYIQKRKHYLGVDVISCNIPLLLSHSSLCRANGKIDIGSSTICILGVTVPLMISSSGHLCLSITRCLDTASKDSNNLVWRVLCSTTINGTNYDTTRNKAKILHKQFCHPKADQLLDFIKKTGISCNPDLEKAIRYVTSKCEVCIKVKRSLKQTINHEASICSNKEISTRDKICYSKINQHQHTGPIHDSDGNMTLAQDSAELNEYMLLSGENKVISSTLLETQYDHKGNESCCGDDEDSEYLTADECDSSGKSKLYSKQRYCNRTCDVSAKNFYNAKSQRKLPNFNFTNCDDKKVKYSLFKSKPLTNFDQDANVSHPYCTSFGNKCDLNIFLMKRKRWKNRNPQINFCHILLVFYL